MMEHLSTLFYRLLMHSSICILEEFFFLFILNSQKKTIVTDLVYEKKNLEISHERSPLEVFCLGLNILQKLN